MQFTPKTESKWLFIIFFKNRIEGAMTILEFISLGKDRIINTEITLDISSKWNLADESISQTMKEVKSPTRDDGTL